MKVYELIQQLAECNDPDRDVVINVIGKIGSTCELNNGKEADVVIDVYERDCWYNVYSASNGVRIEVEL